MESSEIPENPSQYPVHCEIEVRFRDLDAMGHVNNAVYFTYFEVGRTHYMRQLGHWSEDKESTQSMGEKYPFIMLDAYCRFHSAAYVGEKLTAHLRIPALGRKSFRFEYLVTGPDGRAVASGHTAQVAYDYRAGKSVEIPQHFVERIEQLEGRAMREPPVVAET